MGDVKHITLTVRGASQKEIQDAIHYDLDPVRLVDYNRYSKSPDGSSFTVQVGGRVDVGMLYDRLKKLASSVKIAAVVPEDLKAIMTRQEKELSNLKKRKDGLKSKLESVEEENKNLHKKIKDRENSNKKLHEKIKDRENKNKRLHEKIKDCENSNKKLHNKIKDRENSNKLLGTGQLEGQIVYRHRHTSIHELEVGAIAKLMISEDGHRRK